MHQFCFFHLRCCFCILLVKHSFPFSFQHGSKSIIAPTYSIAFMVFCKSKIKHWSNKVHAKVRLQSKDHKCSHWCLTTFLACISALNRFGHGGKFFLSIIKFNLDTLSSSWLLSYISAVSFLDISLANILPKCSKSLMFCGFLSHL